MDHSISNIHCQETHAHVNANTQYHQLCTPWEHLNDLLGAIAVVDTDGHTTRVIFHLAVATAKADGAHTHVVVVHVHTRCTILTQVVAAVVHTQSTIELVVDVGSDVIPAWSAVTRPRGGARVAASLV